MWVLPTLGETIPGWNCWWVWGGEGIWPPHQISEPINANLIRFNVQQCNAVLCVTMHCSTDSEDATSRMRQSSIQKQMWFKEQQHDSLYSIALQCNDMHDMQYTVTRTRRVLFISSVTDVPLPPLSHLWANLWQNLPIDPIATRQDPFSLQPWSFFSQFLS